MYHIISCHIISDFRIKIVFLLDYILIIFSENTVHGTDILFIKSMKHANNLKYNSFTDLYHTS